MLKPLKALLFLALAGCASHPRPHEPRALDWEAEDAASARMAAPAPDVAPTPEPVASPTPLTTPQAAPVVEPKETWVALNRWCKSRSLPIPTLLAMSPLPTFELRSAGGSLILGGGSRIAYWEGMDIRLGYAPHLIDGQMFVHSLDAAKTIAPLLYNAPSSCLRSNSVIVIDPGHGGENAGTRSVLGRYEKEFTLDWARRLQSLLVAKGWQVYLTHSGDTDLALSNRVAFAEAHQAGLFISLHFNSAAPDEGEAGLETYILTPSGMPSTVTRGFSDNPAESFPNNQFDVQNLQFAARVHREILAVNGHRDRGVRRARFLGVLRNQQRPALLIEGGYLSNPAEARLIATPAFRQKLAEAVARSLEGDSLAASQN